MSRADTLLARAYWRATQELRPREGFLEDALAAVLEHREVWPRLVTHLRWEGRVPQTPPVLQTQDHVEQGRTDITLTWPGQLPLVLELKVHQPPHPNQINKYLCTGARVAAVAGVPARIRVDPDAAARYLGVVTWARLRAFSWPAEPLVLRQFHQLLDNMGVVVPNLTLPALTGMVASSPAWGAMEKWSFHTAKAVRKILHRGGLRCELRDGSKKHIKIEYNWQRYGYHLWVPPRRRDAFLISVGLFLGRPQDPLLIEGVPDLMLMIHTNPDHALGQRLHTDGRFREAAQAWSEQGTAAEEHEYLPPTSTWEMVRARTSTVDLLRQPDQGEAFMQWAVRCAEEWVTYGMIARLAELEHETRDGVGTAPSEEEDGAGEQDGAE